MEAGAYRYYSGTDNGGFRNCTHDPHIINNEINNDKLRSGWVKCQGNKICKESVKIR